jgi:hypothetical protein
MHFIFDADPADGTRTALYFSMFSDCFSSRKFVELCHGLLVMFSGPTPDKDRVQHITAHILPKESNVNLYDYVMGEVDLGQTQTTGLMEKINRDILSRFPTSSLKYATRQVGDQLAIMRYVVLSMFVGYKGNEVETTKNVVVEPFAASTRKASLKDPVLSTKRMAASLALAPPSKLLL